jgi:hypothetical protein
MILYIDILYNNPDKMDSWLFEGQKGTCKPLKGYSSKKEGENKTVFSRIQLLLGHLAPIMPTFLYCMTLGAICLFFLLCPFMPPHSASLPHLLPL